MFAMIVKLIILFAVISISSQSDLCGRDDSIDISNGTHLPHGDIMFDGIKYSKNEYYIDSETHEKRGCVCKKRVCLQKCCPHGFGYNPVIKQCSLILEMFKPPVYDEYGRILEVNAMKLFNFSIGKRVCSKENHEVRIQVSLLSNNYHIKEDGNLHIEIDTQIPPWIVRGPDKYCIDNFVTEDGQGGKKVSVDALVCFVQDKEEHHYVLSSTCMLISCVFILATVAVYSWLPELQNLHGWVLIAYLLSFFVGFGFLATMQILLTFDNITSGVCVILTFIIYFSLLSAFFWLNVMCFDIWWTFSGKRGIALSKMTSRGRFQAYSLYAFGFPTALTILMASLEFSGLPAHPLLPRLRQLGCFLYGKSRLLYLYGPMVVLCVANLIFFTLTAVKIASINHQTAMLKSKESATHDKHRNDKQRLLLYVKLFAVMGINWILEVISSLYPELESFWCYTDAYNVLLGVIIFVIFVCKRKIFRLIKKRYKQVRGDSSMSRTQTSSSRTVTSRDDIRMNSVKS